MTGVPGRFVLIYLQPFRAKLLRRTRNFIVAARRTALAEGIDVCPGAFLFFNRPAHTAPRDAHGQTHPHVCMRRGHVTR